MDTGIAAIIVSIVTLIGTIITVASGNKRTLQALQKQSEIDDIKLEAKLKEFKAVTETKMDELTRKVEKHNNLIERMYQVEGAVKELQHNQQRGSN